MPLYVVRFRFGPLPTTLLEVTILVTLGVYALTILSNRAPVPRRTPLDLPIALFLVAGVIGIAVAPDQRSALGIFRAYLVEPVAVYYVSTAVLAADRSARGFLAGWAIGAALFAGIEIVTFWLAVRSGSLDIGHAAAAFNINPNSVSLYLDPLIATAAAFTLFGRGTERLLTAALLGLLVVADIATLSRGGLLALGLLGLIVFMSMSDIRVRVAAVLSAAIGIAAIWQLSAVRLRILNLFEDPTGPLYTREHVWKVSLQMLHDHPVFGAGISGYQTVAAPYRAVDVYNVPEPYAHNIFLSTWSEVGLLGLFAFVWLLAALIVQPWRAIKRAAGIQVPLLWGTGAAFAMVAAHGLVDTPYWKNDLSLEFWVLAALQVVALRAARSSPSRP